ncbi:hypothetical protein QF014_000501 [Pantoea agglomerans]|nr:hypothetical protein [Pantoea agglomerans]
MSVMKRLFPLVYLLFSFVFYTWLSYQFGSNSDNMSSLLIARDLANGNTSLSGWHLSTQSYLFSDIVWTALAIKLFGFTPALSHVMPAIFYSFLSYLSIRIVLLKNNSGLYLVAPVILIPTYFSIANAIELNIHGGIYLLSVACLYLLSNESLKSPISKLLIASLLCGIFAESDKLIVFIFIIPCFISSSIHYVLQRKNKDLIIALACCLSILIYKIASLILPLYFKYDVPGIGGQSIASMPIMITNAILAYQGVLYYFSINFNGDSITTVVSTIKSLFLIIYIVLFIRSAIKSFGKSLVDTLLIFSVLVPFGAFILSTVAIDITSTRFLFFSVLSVALLISRNIAINKTAYKIALILIAVSNLAWIYKSQETEEKYYSKLGDFLQSQNLLNGYGEFWKASILTSVSKVNIYPVFTDGTIRPRYWLSRDDWYERNGNFMISRDQSEIDAAINQFGEPKKIIDFHGMKILVWDKMPLPPNGVSFKKIKPDSLPLRNYRIDVDGGIRSNGNQGFMISGPYARLKKGDYQIAMTGQVYSGNPEAEIFSSKSGVSIKIPMTNSGDDSVIKSSFHLDNDVDDFELRINVREKEEVKIYGYSIFK